VNPGTSSGGAGFKSKTYEIVPASAATQKALRLNAGVRGILSSAGLAAGGGASGQRLTSDDPRYWDLQYRQLEAELINSGLDAESARRQALATLITNRNAQSVDLAQTSGNIAADAAKFAANPRDAVADLHFRNAVGGSTPHGSAMSSPHFPEYQTALQNKMQELFGPTARLLGRAEQNLAAPPPSEFFGPELRGELGLPQGQQLPSVSFTGQGSPVTPNPSAAPAPPAGGAAGGGGITRAQGTEYQANLDRVTQAYQNDPAGAEEFFRRVTEINKGIPPATAEAGANLNIMEPAMIIGKSGRVYATMAETDPEQLIIKPLPSVMERKKKEKESAANFMKMTEGATRMQHGGTVNSIPDASDFIAELRKNLMSLGGTGSGTGAFDTPLPDARLLAGEPARLLGEDPDALGYTQAGYSSFGTSPESLAAAIKKYTPNSARRYSESSLPRVNFA
jgi:hypothetical protein